MKYARRKKKDAKRLAIISKIGQEANAKGRERHEMKAKNRCIDCKYLVNRKASAHAKCADSGYCALHSKKGKIALAKDGFDCIKHRDDGCKLWEKEEVLTKEDAVIFISEMLQVMKLNKEKYPENFYDGLTQVWIISLDAIMKQIPKVGIGPLPYKGHRHYHETYCLYCRSKITDKVNYCPNCGQRCLYED